MEIFINNSESWKKHREFILGDKECSYEIWGKKYSGLRQKNGKEVAILDEKWENILHVFLTQENWELLWKKVQGKNIFLTDYIQLGKQQICFFSENIYREVLVKNGEILIWNMGGIEILFKEKRQHTADIYTPSWEEITNCQMDPRDPNSILAFISPTEIYCRSDDEIITIQRNTWKIIWKINAHSTPFYMEDVKKYLFQDTRSIITKMKESCSHILSSFHI